MRRGRQSLRIPRLLYALLLFGVITSCVDPISFKVPPVSYQLVVDGSITNEPGPYTVYLMRASAINNDLDVRVGIGGATVIMKSDAGEEDVLTEVTRGTYVTNHIQGVVGRSYWLHITTEDGSAYESEREMLNPPGELTNIKPVFHRNDALVGGLAIRADLFDIEVDAKGYSSSSNYYRWRTKGTYAIRTFPHLKTALNEFGQQVPNPPPCSGYVVINGQLEPTDECTCCDCWLTVVDRGSHVSDDTFIQGGEFRNVNIGTVSINRRTFYDKYHLAVEQISLNQKAFEFFRLVKAQKEGASSLFQPPSGRIPSNIKRIDGDDVVSGFFWAGAVSKKSIFIERSEVPYRVPPIDSVILECNLVDPTSVATRPDFWRD